MGRIVATLALVAALPIQSARAAPPLPSTGSGRITGIVTHSKTRAPIPNAVVVLQCACLSGARETSTDVPAAAQSTRRPSDAAG